MDSLSAEPQGKPKNTGVGSLSLLQRIFPTQELNQGLLHCRQIHYQLSYQGSPPKYLGHCESESRSVMSDSLQPHGLYSPWNSPGKDTGVGCHALLQKYIHSKQLINAHKLEAAKQYVALLVRNLPAMQETLVQFLGLEDPLEKG